tara:strand:- start:793 stop:1017 length:225 start_codon:yes stop_codon:yes gene_type:complete
MSTLEYSGDTIDFHARGMADGSYLVEVRQRRQLDKYRDPGGMKGAGTVEEPLQETAVDRAELRDILNRCFPEGA